MGTLWRLLNYVWVMILGDYWRLIPLSYSYLSSPKRVSHLKLFNILLLSCNLFLRTGFFLSDKRYFLMRAVTKKKVKALDYSLPDWVNFYCDDKRVEPLVEEVWDLFHKEPFYSPPKGGRKVLVPEGLILAPNPFSSVSRNSNFLATGR